jgi:hypothetical protein
MKLSTYARQLGISYQTAWRLFKDGKLNAYQLPSHCQGRRVSGLGTIRGYLLSRIFFGEQGQLGITEEETSGLLRCERVQGEQGHNRSRFRDKRHPQTVAVFTARPDGKDYCRGA